MTENLYATVLLTGAHLVIEQLYVATFSVCNKSDYNTCYDFAFQTFSINVSFPRSARIIATVDWRGKLVEPQNQKHKKLRSCCKFNLWEKFCLRNSARHVRIKAVRNLVSVDTIQFISLWLKIVAHSKPESTTLEIFQLIILTKSTFCRLLIALRWEKLVWRIHLSPRTKRSKKWRENLSIGMLCQLRFFRGNLFIKFPG